MIYGKKYFNHWADTNGSHYKFTEIFISQEAVCQKHKELEEWNVNPLTIRLCLLQEVFGKLFDARLKIRQKTSNPGYTYHQSQVAYVSGVTSSMVVTMPGYMGETFSLDLHEIYKNTYAFCSFFSAVLDRLAFEIHILYKIGNQDIIDWRKFKNKNGKNGDLFNDLVQKNKMLSDVIFKNDFSRILEVRDSFEHGKKMEISATSLNADFDFTIKCDGTENKVVEFFYVQIVNLLNLCENFYKSID
jgi:hypothetical protein